MKTKKVAGVDLPASSFAFVGDENDTVTWALPIFVSGNVPLSRNLLKSALFRFSHTKNIPVSERQTVALTLNGACRAHGIKVGAQPANPQASGLTGKAHTLDAEDAELKAARAVGELAAERFLKQIGY